MPATPFDEMLKDLRSYDRHIGALEFKLRVIKELQDHGYDPRIQKFILEIPTTEKE